MISHRRSNSRTFVCVDTRIHAVCSAFIPIIESPDGHGSGSSDSTRAILVVYSFQDPLSHLIHEYLYVCVQLDED